MKQSRKCPTMKNQLIIIFLVLSLNTLSCNRFQTPPTVSPTVIIIVRHAEKTGSGSDPNLGELGARRAQALIDVAEESGVSAIYSSQYKRAQETAQPISRRLNVPITQFPVIVEEPGNYAEVLARDVLTKHQGQTILVVTHSNIIPSIVQSLTQKSLPTVDQTEYNHLFIIVVPKDGPSRLIKAQYGSEIR